MEKLMGLYVHIPFCNKKCDYCDFTSYVMDKIAQEKYLKSLFKEIDLLKDKFTNKSFDSLYIGGGTPSIVFDGFILKLSKKIFKSFNFTKDTEFTIEINPSSFNNKKLEEYKKAKVNRISIGVQSLNSKLLKFHGRNQNTRQVKSVLKMLKDNNFNNISCDLMIGLPHQKNKDIIKTTKFLIKNDIKHISTYTLQVEENTELYKRVDLGLKLKSDEFIVKNYEKVGKLLEKSGYERYEISNFALKNFKSRHNQKYWNETEYLGLGISSHSYINKVRIANTKNFNTYLECLNNNKLPIDFKENIDKNTRITERIMLSLRTKIGLNLKDFKKDFKIDLLKLKQKEIDSLIELNMVEIVNGYLRINPEKFSVSNRIILEII